MQAGPGPEERAIAYLAREVPLWSKDNRCFSCHNNGDGARALYAAVRLHKAVPPESLANSTEWLSQPTKWDSNRGNPAFSDKKLARIQFAAALAAGVEAGLVSDRDVLVYAADSLRPYQEKDGSWQVDVGTALGSPVTYGSTLATVMARRALAAANESRFAGAIAKADQWLAARKPESVMDAAAILMAVASRKDCVQFLHAAQNSDGGWGPQPLAPTEVFDTALALLGLSQAGSGQTEIARGRSCLVQTQLPPGGWPETTRPTGAQSYAQHISTSAWATLALLATDPKR